RITLDEPFLGAAPGQAAVLYSGSRVLGGGIIAAARAQPLGFGNLMGGTVKSIETPRLTIRLPQIADVPEVIRYYRENRDHLQPFSPAFAPDFLEVATWLEQISVRGREFETGDSFRAFLFERDSPAR